MVQKMCMLIAVVFIWSVASVSSNANAQSTIIDHTCTKLNDIPDHWIRQAKENLHIVYGHTSHGSHISKGMNGLYEWKGDLYAWNHGGSGGALDMHNYNRSFPSSNGTVNDLGSPNRTAWVNATREYLNSHPEINVVMWAWCGQVNTSAHYIENEYLSNMNQLETEYPHVKFVYMTGHLDGTGLEGRVHTNNDIIRNYCRENGKILFDFEDIESYDPDGNYYGDKYATDGCNYDYNGDGRTDQTGDPATPLNGDRNWAIDWQNSHVEWDGSNDEAAEWYGYGEGSPLNGNEFRISHSQPINQNQKAYAAWHLWARLAGWGGVNAPSNLQAQVVTTTQINLSWDDSFGDELGFRIERGEGGSFSQIAMTSANAVTFSDTTVEPGVLYTYRVSASTPEGNSNYSNEARARTSAPASPTEFAPASVSHDAITLSWSGTLEFETGFVIERSLNGTDFSQIAELPENTTSYHDRTGINPLTTYHYRIRAFNAVGSSAHIGISVETPEFTNEPVEQTICQRASEWRYFEGTAEPPSDWKDIGFDDATWKTGQTVIGYGDPWDYGVDLHHMRNSFTSFYMRYSFTSNFTEVHAVSLSIDYDDGFVAYLNGEEIARSNVSGTPAFNSVASANHESGYASPATPYTYSGDTHNARIQQGNNVLAIHVLNASSSSSDIAIDPEFSITGVRPVVVDSRPNAPVNLRLR